MENTVNNQNMVMDWNDSIENDGQEFVLLPEGDYNFTITNFERGRFPGGQKVPACNKAGITIQIETNVGIAIVKFDLLLYRSLEWRISSFFRCIGQKKSGEKLVMNWNTVVGSKGRAHIKQRVYTNNYGEDKTVNDLDRFIDFKPEYFEKGMVNEIEISDADLPF
jgi:hypothetical protein